MNAEFHEWLVARPMETAIDFSRPGETVVAFHQTCSCSHGEMLYLDCELDDKSELSTEEPFATLSGSVVISDADGKEIESVQIDGKSMQYIDGTILLAGFAPFPKGDYVATVRVDSRVEALADSRQTLYARYQLCGLEQMPAMITGGFAFGAAVIGLIAAVSVLPDLLRNSIWHTTEKAEPDGEKQQAVEESS
jgi:hypothetical protein